MRGPRSPARRALCAALLAFAPLRALRSAAPSPAAPLFEGMGAYRLADASTLPLAQRYADQGMVLAFGFNPAEAARSFEAAVSIDPRSAACWWALAWSLGPTINTDAAPEDVPRIERALARATALAKQAPARYQELVAALATRHRPGKKIDEEAYAAQMRVLAKRRPHDADVALLAAEAVLNLHPYDWWESDGRPKPWTAEIQSLLEQALAADPGHPGAHHYIVHLYELSRTPERGIASADRLAQLAPGSGHLVHMPAHIFMRTGRYADASAANRRSIEADQRYLAQVDAQGAYRVGYVAHNHHFLWASAAMQGRSREAIAAARAAWPAACGPDARDRSTAILQHYYALPLYALIRFGQWSAILSETLPPDVAEPYPMTVWHYARGTALSRTGRMAEAREALARVERLASHPKLDEVKVKNLNAASTLARIAGTTLRADLEMAERRPTQALPLYARAVTLEDSLVYDEPHLWLAPTRHALGSALLAAGRALDAERTFRQDLAHYPENGWALKGLSRALRAQGRNEAAKDTDTRFRVAWRDADIRIDSARL